MKVQVGDQAWTPVEPYVMVEVISIYHRYWSGRDYARVRYLDDHHHHQKDSEGEYYLEDLTPVFHDSLG
jgi:hypothetical protein